MGKQVSSSEAIKEIKRLGWVEVRAKSSHVTFKHPDHALLITVKHPAKSLSPGLIRSIERIAGVRF